jgi:purine-nucleoside phosphorylase
LILLVAAVSEELGDLPGEPLGVGHTVAAARMATLLAESRPSAVVMLGTAGSYQGGPEVGTAVAARRVGLSLGVAVMGLGYVPRPPVPCACDTRLLDRLDLPAVDVLSVGAVTTDEVLASRLSDGWQIEQMEAYGAAHACAQAGVPFVGIFGISNRVGPEAHVEWMEHRGEAREQARAAATQLLGAPKFRQQG